MNNLSAPYAIINPYADTTILHPLVAVLIGILVLVVLTAKRRYVIVAFIIALNLITAGQRLYVLGMNLPALRILVIAGVVRVFLRGETRSLQFLLLDRIVILYSVVAVVAHFLRMPFYSTLVSDIGATLDRLGAYLVVRIVVRNHDDFRIVVRTFALLSLLLVMLFFHEHRTGHNVFALFGGTREISEFRENGYRASGPYSHSILAGTLWASILPLYIGYRNWGKQRSTLLLVAVPIAAFLVYFSDSSTPLAAMAVGIIASVLYYQRDLVSPLRITVLAAVLGIAVFWWHPVWYLFTKIDLTGGSASYFRYLLVDNFVRHWREWVLIGTNNAHYWGAGYGLGGLGLADATNQFVAEGLSGGVAKLALFTAAMIVAFRYVAALVATARGKEERLANWQIGASALVHGVSFLGISYFGQVVFSWWMLIAVCASLFQDRFRNQIQTSSRGDTMNEAP